MTRSVTFVLLALASVASVSAVVSKLSEQLSDEVRAIEAGACRDVSGLECPEWASLSWCRNHPFMTAFCPKACGVCGPGAVPYVQMPDPVSCDGSCKRDVAYAHIRPGQGLESSCETGLEYTQITPRKRSLFFDLVQGGCAGGRGIGTAIVRMTESRIRFILIGGRNINILGYEISVADGPRSDKPTIPGGRDAGDKRVLAAHAGDISWMKDQQYCFPRSVVPTLETGLSNMCHKTLSTHVPHPCGALYNCCSDVMLTIKIHYCDAN